MLTNDIARGNGWCKAKSIPHVVGMPSKEKMAAAEHYSPKVSRGGKSLQMQRISKAIPSVKKKKRKFSNIRETICSTQK